ncbi:MAG TPA: hypothetical protein VF870_09485 [Ignavibacteriaceae bacterium]
MPLRTTANNRQRKFFNDLFSIDELVLTIKNGETCSMNAHGSFELFDKHWDGIEYQPYETMIALKENKPAKICSEPSVHFHINWLEVKYVSIRLRRLELINTDYEIVFCNERDTNARVFWFYARYDSALRCLIANWNQSWINLCEGSISNLENIELKSIEYSQKFEVREMQEY